MHVVSLRTIINKTCSGDLKKCMSYKWFTLLPVGQYVVFSCHVQYVYSIVGLQLVLLICKSLAWVFYSVAMAICQFKCVSQDIYFRNWTFSRLSIEVIQPKCCGPELQSEPWKAGAWCGFGSTETCYSFKKGTAKAINPPPCPLCESTIVWASQSAGAGRPT